MKRLLILFTLSVFAFAAQAQFPGGGGGGSSVTGRIIGTVIDSISKKPVDYATITLYRSGGKAILNGVVTDSKGVFRINNISAGKYKVTISFIGYPSKTIDPVTTTPGKPDANLGNVLLAPTGRTLKGVNIVADAPIVENRIDKLVYNAEKDITTSGGNATDVLRKVPLLSVDMDGNVSLRGDQNVRVLINGKPSGAVATSLADVLKTIPADQIKNVEVITSPSAKYDAEGSGGIINIITKSSKASGLSGSVSGGVGTRQNNGNVNLNYKHNRLSLGANIGGNGAWPQTSLVDFNSVSSGITRTQNATSRTTRQGIRGSINGSYDFNDYNAITTTVTLNSLAMTNNGGGFNTNSLFGTSGYSSTNYNKTSLGGFDWNADYTHKFKKQGEELTIAGQWSHTGATNDYATTYLGVPTAFISYTPNQTGTNDGTNNEYTAQIDYALPINTKIKFEAGGKSIFRQINSDFEVYRQNNNTGPYLLNDAASNLYDYNQNVYAGYSVFTFQLPKSYSLQTGARVENTQIDGTPSNRTQPNLSAFSNSYNSFVPSLAISKQLKGGSSIKLNYTKRIQRPSLTQINPFINRANADNQTQGSPTLSPEITQTAELGYTLFIKSSVVILSTYYKHTNGLIEGIADTIRDADLNNRLITRTNYRNVGKNNSVGISAAGSINPIKPLTIRGSANLYTYSPVSYTALNNQQSSNSTYLQYNIFTGASLILKDGFAAELFGVFNSKRRNIQGYGPAFNIYGFGLKKDIVAKKFTLGLNALSPFQKYLHLNTNINSANLTQTQSISYPIRSFGISFTYNFGKITYGQQTKKKGVNNDDLLPGDNGNGGGGVPSGSTGGRPQ